MKDRIDDLRAILNKELESKDVNADEILKLSQILDDYIVEYYNLKIEQEKGLYDSNIKYKGKDL